ncbi:MAG: UvrD-helicase domain-containing protein, partial [Leadbetterella sp.]|nr:UvrD-helicase domain-containing protein [Leadbetterella sp.]
MNNNRLIVAAAGSGKTTFLVNEALRQKTGKVLLSTFTRANEAEILKKIIEINRCIPKNITVQTWFSFLLQHGVRPYQGVLFEKNIKGLVLVSGQSGVKYYFRGNPVCFGEEKEFEKHYFTDNFKIYSDKLPKFVCRCNKITKGEVIDRLSRIYSHILIDEVQDLSGYDLELLRLLFKCKIVTLLVGDPRQGTYSTSNSAKNKKFSKSKIVHFFEDTSIDIETDADSFTINYRCVSEICNLSNRLFPDLKKAASGNNNRTEHDGVFLVRTEDVENYLKKYKPMQLRDSIKTKTNRNYKAMNFGESKGLSFDRVLIYPTQPFVNWLIDNKSELASTSRSKFYVAITRARYSVGIIYDYSNRTE